MYDDNTRYSSPSVFSSLVSTDDGFKSNHGHFTLGNTVELRPRVLGPFGCRELPDDEGSSSSVSSRKGNLVSVEGNSKDRLSGVKKYLLFNFVSGRESSYLK
jgi:hypothetical protein